MSISKNHKSGIRSGVTPGRVLPDTTLGVGYSTDQEMARSFSCINGHDKFGEGGETIIKFNDTKSFSSVERIITHHAHANASIDAFVIDAGESYLKDMNDTVYSESFFYMYEIILPSKTFTPNVFGVKSLNSLGRGAYNAGPAQFRESCGDLYVSEEFAGANLIASMKLHFETISDKETFSAHLKAGYSNYFDITAQFQKIFEETSIHAQLNFAVMQLGGDGSQLSKIISKDPSGNYHITSCTLKTLDECQKVITDVFNYGDNNFAKQIEYSNGTVKGNPYQLNITTSSYGEIGLNKMGPSILTPDIIKARINLTNTYDSIKHDQDFINHIVNYCLSSGDKGVKEQLEDLNDVLSQNMEILMDSYTGAIDCYFDPENCVRTAQVIYATMSPANTSILGKFDPSCGLDLHV